MMQRLMSSSHLWLKAGSLEILKLQFVRRLNFTRAFVSTESMTNLVPSPIRMPKIHPNSPQAIESQPSVDPMVASTEAVVMTVWRKSLLFNCKGFTVYDAKGNLVFRVDNYTSSSNGEIILMDVSGKCLMTIRKKRLSLSENWLIYEGEETANHQFSIKKHLSFLHSKDLAYVTTRRSHHHSYAIEGSYSQHRCTVYDDQHRPVVEVKRKETATGMDLGCDVFRLVVGPGLDAKIAMAVVIVLEQMYGS